MSDQPEPTPDQPALMGLLAERLRMTEGQLYTAVLGIALVVLLSLTGLPHAHQRGNDDSLSGTNVLLEPQEGAP